MKRVLVIPKIYSTKSLRQKYILLSEALRFVRSTRLTTSMFLLLLIFLLSTGLAFVKTNLTRSAEELKVSS